MTGAERELPSFGVVILTQGKRPAELARGVASVLAQREVSLDIVVVGNGWAPAGLPKRCHTLHLPQNLGIPAGRNAGVAHVGGEFLFFLDDDAWLPDDDFLLRSARYLGEHDDVAMLQPRIEDPETHERPRRWIPRLRKGSPLRSSNVFSVIELALVLRRDTFESTGGWPGTFFYAHEGIELAWRVWDCGMRVVYLGDLRAAHPIFDPARHAEYFELNARNRVWLARRNLPWPVSWAYVGTWTVVQLIRWRSRPEQLKPWLAGWRRGWLADPWAPDETRGKLRWSTVVAMTRAGRPPVV